MSSQPKVSVIISCYNYGRYLTSAIHSLIGGITDLGRHPGQTHHSFDIIIINDASTDNTKTIGKTLAEKENIRYIELAPANHPDGQTNNGTAVANNTGIDAAHSEYIAILCADDMMEPARLGIMATALDNNPHSLIYDNMMQFTAGQRTKTRTKPDYNFNLLKTQNHVHAGTMFTKTAWSKAGGYPEEMRYGREDWAFAVTMGIHGYYGIKLQQPLYLYRAEGQGRSTRNATIQWQKRFQTQINSLLSTGKASPLNISQNEAKQVTECTH